MTRESLQSADWTQSWAVCEGGGQWLCAPSSGCRYEAVLGHQRVTLEQVLPYPPENEDGKYIP